MIQATDGGRRRSPRLTTRVEGALQGRTRRDVVVLELSLTGCLVRCASALDRGTILDLALRFGPEPFEVKVRVSQSSVEGSPAPGETPHFLAGLEFLGLPAREEAQLRRFIQEERRRKSADALPQ